MFHESSPLTSSSDKNHHLSGFRKNDDLARSVHGENLLSTSSDVEVDPHAVRLAPVSNLQSTASAMAGDMFWDTVAGRVGGRGVGWLGVWGFGGAIRSSQSLTAEA